MKKKQIEIRNILCHFDVDIFTDDRHAGQFRLVVILA